MIVVNSQKDSVSPLPLPVKLKKGKSQTMTPTLPKDLTSTTSDEDTAKTTPRPEGSLRDKDSGENIPHADMEPINPTITDPSGTGEMDTQPLVLSTYGDERAFLLFDDEAQETKEDILGAASDTDSSCNDILKKYDNTLPLTERQLVKYLRKVSNALFSRITKDNLEKHEEAATDKLVEASMSSLDKSNNTISNLYKGFNIITELLKEIKNAVKDDPVINKKISEATESFTKISTNITEVLSLVKGFNFFDLQSFVNALQAHALKQDEELAAWAKSSTNMAWNLGSRLLGLEQAQNHIQSSMSSLKEDTHSIKTIVRILN
ncbi:hypothetical protein Tco_1471507 [Tanacetum coccineum]